MWHRDRPGVVRVAVDTSLAGWCQQAVERVDVLGAAVEPDAAHEAEAAIAGRVGLPDDCPVARIFFRWEPAPILVCVEDPTEDLDYVSKKCTSTTRVPYSLHFPLLSFTKQRGWTPKSKPRIFSSHPPP